MNMRLNFQNLVDACNSPVKGAEGTSQELILENLPSAIACYQYTWKLM